MIKPEDNSKLYFVSEREKFSSLTELVTYYRQYPIPTDIDRRIFLDFGIPKRTVSIKEDWYMPELNRQVGIRLLEKMKYNGCFFVRGAETFQIVDNQSHAYTLCFYMNHQVCQARIHVEIEDFKIRYFINNTEFSSLKSIIDCYKMKPVFGNQKLTKSLKSMPDYEKLRRTVASYVSSGVLSQLAQTTITAMESCNENNNASYHIID